MDSKTIPVLADISAGLAAFGSTGWTLCRTTFVAKNGGHHRDEDEQAPAGPEAVLAEEDLVKNERLRGREGVPGSFGISVGPGFGVASIFNAPPRASEIDSAFPFHSIAAEMQLLRRGSPFQECIRNPSIGSSTRSGTRSAHATHSMAASWQSLAQQILQCAWPVAGRDGTWLVLLSGTRNSPLASPTS